VHLCSTLLQNGIFKFLLRAAQISSSDTFCLCLSVLERSSGAAKLLIEALLLTEHLTGLGFDSSCLLDVQVFSTHTSTHIFRLFYGVLEVIGLVYQIFILHISIRIKHSRILNSVVILPSVSGWEAVLSEIIVSIAHLGLNRALPCPNLRIAVDH